MRGYAFAFLRRNGAPLPGTNYGGHLGWGFLDMNGHYYFGSTENQSGSPLILPGQNNGWWGMNGTEQDMYREMDARNYDGYKVIVVQNPNPTKAWNTALDTKGRGFAGIFNNCLDHTYDVLEHYGVIGMPWKQTHPAPNDWFGSLNGEFHNL